MTTKKEENFVPKLIKRNILKTKTGVKTGKKTYISYQKYSYEETSDQHELIMATISDVKVLRQGEKKVGLIVYFSDGDEIKSICHKDDVFDLEVGISTCITKKLIADMLKNKDAATGVYNKIIKDAVKTMKKNAQAESDALEKKAEEKRIADKIAAKKARRKAKRRARQREEAIEDMAEAIRRASVTDTDDIPDIDGCSDTED